VVGESADQVVDNPEMSVMDDAEMEGAADAEEIPGRPGDGPTGMRKHGEAGEEPDDGSPGPSGDEQGRGRGAVRRRLKLVLTLEPAGGNAYRVLVALGADGCDPLLRTLEAANVSVALGIVPALVAEAEERWRTQPRYPTASAASKARPAAAAGKASEAPAPPKEDQQRTAESERGRHEPTKPPSTEQLSLFG
jgi:hypothetical protein